MKIVVTTRKIQNRKHKKKRINRGTCDYFIVDKIEEIINKYKQESEEYKI